MIDPLALAFSPANFIATSAPTNVFAPGLGWITHPSQGEVSQGKYQQVYTLQLHIFHISTWRQGGGDNLKIIKKMFWKTTACPIRTGLPSLKPRLSLLSLKRQREKWGLPFLDSKQEDVTGGSDRCDNEGVWVGGYPGVWRPLLSSCLLLGGPISRCTPPHSHRWHPQSSYSWCFPPPRIT